MDRPPGNYRIVGTPQEVSGIHPETDQVVNGMRVTARHLDSGVTTHVFIPHEDYSAENVDAQLKHRFRHHHQVMALGHDETPESPH